MTVFDASVQISEYKYSSEKYALAVKARAYFSGVLL
jgi:hypothetical protein